ncbi:MAG: NifB/NifX family molybdenum-iron cluster-binding protein [Anaerotignum sp.]|nr:NifB/NifX family molybdenum-iron cluster-binding protein [Anaerotignum sp.]
MKTKIAVTYENGEVFQHFGHTKEFKFYTVEDGKIIDTEIVPTLGSGHSLLADFLLVNGVTLLICGGIGGGAKMALAQKGIELRGGVSGNADQRVEEYLNGTLEFNAAVECNHHHDGDHEGCSEHDHHCGGHCH